MVSSPEPPNPYATAAAQTASNKETAAYQQQLNMVSQNTPYGSIKYDQTGTASNGAPQYTATTSLDPKLQGLVDLNLSNNQSESNIQGRLAGNVADSLSHNVDLGPSALQKQMNAQNAVTMDPQWARLGEQTEQTSYDRGLAPGSDGYNTAMGNFSNQRNAAYNSAWNANEGAAQNALLAQYNQPLNSLNALKTGSQVTQPGIGQTAQTPQTGVAGTNIAGLIEQNYAQQQAQSNAAMGGLFGLAGSGIGAVGQAGGFAAMFSDRRLKKDVTRIGTSRLGLPIYAFRYVWGGPLRSGHMADEVARVRPDAVGSSDGWLTVDYGAL